MADTKLKNLTEATSVSDSDILYTVVDPSGTPADRKVTKANLLKDEFKGPASSTDNAVIRFDGTTGKLAQNSTVTIDDSGNIVSPLSITMANGSAVTVAAGKMWYNATTGSWNLGMGGGNITQQVGEEIYRYGKASAIISDTPLQIIYKTGTVGGSNTITFGPTVANITNAELILGCATEPIALNGFGRITTYGMINDIDTSGASYSETWDDGDDIWYNPTTGNPTKTKPTAPKIKVQIGIVIKAGSGTSGSFMVKMGSSSTLGGTDSNVELGSLANNDFIVYNSSTTRWENYSAANAKTAIGLSNVTNVAQLPASYLDTDGTLAANSDTKVASQKATKTYADTKLTNSMSTGKLLGRGTAGTGVVEEITLGTNLSFSGTTLNATGGAGGGDVTGPSSAVANNFASFDGTTGKIIKDSGYTNTSFVAANSVITGATKTKVTYDAKGLVTAGADATTADIADSTNKRYVTDANLTVIGNTSGTNTGDETQATIKTKLGAATTSVDGYLTSTDWNTFNGKQAALGFTAENVANKSTSTSLGTSDTLYPTQNAVKVYADSLLGNANALVYKGVIDCSTNPNYPAADAGFMYIASVAGKIGGASGIDVEVGDMIICNTDGTASGNQATVGAYWNVIQKNIVGAVTGPASSTNNNVAFFDGTTGKVIKDSGLTLSGSNTGDQVVPSNTTETTGSYLAAYNSSTGAFTKTALPTSSDTVAGIIEIATSAEVTTGTDNIRAISPDALAGSTIFGVKAVGFQIVADATGVDTTSGVLYFNVPQALNGMNLIRANAYVTTAGTTNATTVQVRNMTKYASNDSLSTAISIASGGTTGTAGTVSTSYDDVATDDLIKIYVTAQSTTKPKGLRVNLEYQLP